MDNIYLATVLTVNMISIILIDFRFLSDNINPVIVFVVAIISFVIFLIIYKVIIGKIISDHSKRLFSAYPSSKGILPAISPMVFFSNEVNNVLLSHEAFAVIQSFNSLKIKSAREFYLYVFIGTYLKMIPLKNLDFIKWGLSYFHDTTTAIICTQVCRYFKGNTQTQTILIQQLNEKVDLPFFLVPIIYNLVLYHSDLVSDNPVFFSKILKKAKGGIARCQRCLSIFWGCVLKHSQMQMDESLCKLRDTICETKTHFNELNRCYPFKMETIELHLNFMTEIWGQFTKCNQYINKISNKFIEMKSDAIDNNNSEPYEEMSLLLNDSTRGFSPYLSKLTQYMDQEALIKHGTNGPIVSTWTLSIISSLTLIICIVIIMSVTLVSLYEYPTLLSIVNSADEIFIEMASLIVGARRICLFASGSLNYTDYEFNEFDASVYDTPYFLLPWLIDRTEELPSLILKFHKNMTSNLEILDAINRRTRKFKVFSSEMDGKLTFIIDMLVMSIRNIAANIPSNFVNISCLQQQSVQESLKKIRNSRMKPKIDFDFDMNATHDNVENYTGICKSSELRLLLENIEMVSDICDDFIDEFQIISERKVNYLTRLLTYSMIFFPICYIVLFGGILLYLFIYIHREAKFRLTLFLSLPEQVAFEIYNSDSSLISNIKKTLDQNEIINNEIINNEIINNEIIENEEKPKIEMMSVQGKAKALKIESLHQYSTIDNIIKGIGIKEFAISGTIFIIIAALSMFSLTYYSKMVNVTFQSRSNLLCTSALRYSSVSYAFIFIEESFISNELSIFNTSEIIRLSEKYIERAKEFHTLLTQGGPKIKLDFREYKGIEDMFLNKVVVPPFDSISIKPSYALIRHSGYRYDSIDTFLRLFISSSYGILETFKKDNNFYKLNDNTWNHFSHLLVAHLIDEMKESTSIYLKGVSEIINNSFRIALIVSIFSLLILLAIFVICILSSAKAISKYFKTSLHILCQINPDIFNRSIYINKWLKGQITRFNYNQYEIAFKRNIPTELKDKILQDSKEKILLFSSNGEYIETPSLDTSSIKEKSLPNLLNLVLKKSIDQNTIDEIQKAFEKFQEAKDKIDDYELIVNLPNHLSNKLTVIGIQSDEIGTSMQRFYTYILILVNDYSQESKYEFLYEEEVKKTLGLMKQLVPSQFANRIHQGEEFISVTTAIGSILSVVICNYDECLQKLDLRKIPVFIKEMRNLITKAVSEFDNISLMSVFNNEILCVAGVFNEEQNGNMEATDMLQFTSRLSELLLNFFESNNLLMTLKFGVATGGPFYSKAFIDSDSISNIVSGDIINVALLIREFCTPGNIIIDKITYECISSLNIVANQGGEYVIDDKKNPYYSISLEKNVI